MTVPRQKPVYRLADRGALWSLPNQTDPTKARTLSLYVPQGISLALLARMPHCASPRRQNSLIAPLTAPLSMRIASTWSRDAFVGDLRREFHRVGATELARGRILSVAALPTSGDRYVIAEARGKTRRFALIKAHISYSRRLSGTPQRTDKVLAGSRIREFQ